MGEGVGVQPAKVEHAQHVCACVSVCARMHTCLSQP